MWPQPLQIFNGGDTTFPSLFTANMTVGSVSCCKKLMRFQIDHVSTPTSRDRFCSQYRQCHYSSLNKEKSNFQGHPILPAALAQGQPRSMGHSCRSKTWSWPGPVPAQKNPTTTNWRLPTQVQPALKSRHLLAKMTSCILHQIFEVSAALFTEELVISKVLRAR